MLKYQPKHMQVWLPGDMLDPKLGDFVKQGLTQIRNVLAINTQLIWGLTLEEEGKVVFKFDGGTIGTTIMRTSLTSSETDIFSATIRINPIAIKGINPNKKELASLILHEIGHVLGLEHVEGDKYMRVKPIMCKYPQARVLGFGSYTHDDIWKMRQKYLGATGHSFTVPDANWIVLNSPLTAMDVKSYQAVGDTINVPRGKYNYVANVGDRWSLERTKIVKGKVTL